MTPQKFHQQHERVRQSLMRASTAVAIVLLVVLLLALAAIALGWHATRLRVEAEDNRRRAEQAENQARSDLGRASLSDARATRLGNDISRRASALESIQRAAAIQPSPELRREAVATLALPDFRFESLAPDEPGVIGRAFHPKLKSCAVGLTNGDVFIKSLSSGTLIRRLRKADAQISEEFGDPARLSFSPDGSFLSVRYRGGAGVIWDVANGNVVFTHDTNKVVRPGVEALFSGDSRFIVIATFGPPEGLAVIDLKEKRRVGFFPEASAFYQFAVRPVGALFAAVSSTNSATRGPTALVFDWSSGERIAEFPFPKTPEVIEWSPNGRWLGMGGNSLDVHVWDFTTRQRLVLSGHASDVSELVFSADNHRLAVYSRDGSSRFWDLRDGRLLGVTSEGMVRCWSDGDRLGIVRAKRGMEVRTMAPSSVYHELTGPVDRAEAGRMDVSRDGNWAISAFKEEGIFVWNLRQPGIPEWVPFPGIYAAHFDAATPRILIARRSGSELRDYQTVQRQGRPALQLSDPRPLPTVPGENVELFATSPNGAVASYALPWRGLVWTHTRASNGAPLKMEHLTFNSLVERWCSASGSGPLSVSPDGQWMACGESGYIGTRVYNTRTGEVVAKPSVKQSDVQFSPDGQWLVSAQAERCQVFRTSDWSRVTEFAFPRYNFRPCAAFSPDSATLAVANGRIVTLLDVASGRELTDLEAPKASPVTSVRWCAEGTLAVATRENRIDLWKPDALRRELASLGLDWDAPLTPKLSPAALAPIPTGRNLTTWIAAGVSLTVVVAAAVALLALRRHRLLIEDFSRTEALAAQRETELRGEREISRLKSNFVSMVSHEFRTPLGVISVASEVLARYFDRLAPDQRRTHLDDILQNVRRMARMMEDVLLLSRVDSGRMEFRPERIDLEPFCRKLVDEVFSATNGACPIQLECNLPTHHRYHADEALLRHILTNLLTNAVKYSHPGTPVSLQVENADAHVVFNVADHGIGIPDQDRENLFQAFHRAGNAEHIHGTGLGLVIVKRCCDIHGGAISFTSAVGQGTTFQVRLPLALSPNPQQGN